MSTFEIQPITDQIGAQVFIQPERLLDEGVPEVMLEALNQYAVLVFPGLFLDDDSMVAFSNRIGDMEAATVTADGSDQSRKGIYRIAKDKSEQGLSEYVQGNDYWHMDGTSYEMPGKATLLKCESPPNVGGETDFANLISAYLAMPEPLKSRIDKLTVLHSMEAAMRKFRTDPSEEDIARWNRIFPPTPHPLVWRMRDGRISLVIGATACGIEGMEQAEGDALLQELVDWCTQDAFTYRHSWSKGDLVVFNNPLLLHRSQPYGPDSGRQLHRTTVKGVEPFN